jgi:hypothetical protein
LVIAGSPCSQPSCVPQKVAVNQKATNQTWYSHKN